MIRIEAPYFLGFERNYTVAAGQTLYTVANAIGTPTITLTATGLPSGVTISSNGAILGAPVSGSAGVYPVVVRATNGFAVTEYSITITVTNQAPSFASANATVISGAAEDTPFTISYAGLAAALDDSDPNGDPLSFRIESVAGGTLTKNGVPVAAGATSIDPGEILVWTPPANFNGTRDAFTVKAYDGALYSATTKTVQVAVAPVNDLPAFTQFSGPVATGNEDSSIAISFAELMTKGDEADIDSTVTGFVVKEVTTGTLRIGTSEATATAWNATTNKAIMAGLNGYWTPDPKCHWATGGLSGSGPGRRQRGVRDAGAAGVVTVNPVNDAPTLTDHRHHFGSHGKRSLRDHSYRTRKRVQRCRRRCRRNLLPGRSGFCRVARKVDGLYLGRSDGRHDAPLCRRKTPLEPGRGFFGSAKRVHCQSLGWPTCLCHRDSGPRRRGSLARLALD